MPTTVTRTWDESQPPVTLSVRWALFPGLNATSPQTSKLQFTAVDTVFRGDNIPGWRYRLKTGQSCTTDLSGTRHRLGGFTLNRATMTLRRWEPSLHNYSHKTYILEGFLGFPGVVVPSTNGSSLQATRQACRMVFHKRILEAQRSIQGGVFLGELGETIRMIKNPLKLLYKGAYNYLEILKKRSKRGRARITQKVLSDTWLEQAFGWQPLISDIQDAARAAAKLAGDNPCSKRVNAVSQSSDGGTSSEVVDKPYPSTGTLFKVTSSLKTVQTTKVRCSGQVRLHNEFGDSGALDTFGLSLRDLVPTLWELIPYSFLIDYFTNVGDLINYYSVRQGDISWSEEGYMIDCTTTVAAPEVKFLVEAGWELVEKHFDHGGQAFISKRVVNRGALGGIGPMPFQLEVPGVGSLKWLNIAALALGSKRTSKQLSSY